MLSLPDTLLLFALHDDKGTVHPSAFLALDHALRGAMLGELRLRGCVKTWRSSRIELTDRGAGDDLLDHALEILRAALPPKPGVLDAMTALAGGLPDLRARVILRLESAGILVSADKERVLLPGTKTHPMTDATMEAAALGDMRSALDDEAELTPRRGALLALVEACGLVDVLFDPDERAAAAATATLVRRRDAIAEAVQEAVERTAGLWE